MIKRHFLLLVFFVQFVAVNAAGTNPFISHQHVPRGFAIAGKGYVASIVMSDNDWPGVKRAALDLQQDLKSVTGLASPLLVDAPARRAIIIGTIGKSKAIDQLIASGRINVAGVAGQWESNLIQVVHQPMEGIDSALVIAGSDKRGTIYGIYEMSYQIGVSPWYYWADVPVKKYERLYAVEGRHITASPAVKYRGIFLNDEAPALSGWAKKEFGGFNHKFYEKVFELILRLKGNYLWPAMWGSAFNDDDVANPVKADEYGIVMGTSHHEPLMRAHDEWRRYGKGQWNYDKNEEVLKEFWRSGLARTQGKEQIISVGMRGDGDEPMTEGTATDLLERIVKDQRAIIEEVSKKPASESPQLWALYKEVQDYYDKGMRVPDDVTLLLCDDNWGNLRKLPKLNEAPRSGGYGIYYHFDYVGGPRNYKWINTNPIQKVWEQMNLAYEYDATRIWIVNVGDLKPMEFPIEFFLDYAWAPSAIPASKLFDYTVKWSHKQFGDDFALEIANLLDSYSKFNGRVKPELLNADTYSLVNYNEFERVVADYQKLVEKAEYINKQLPAGQRDAFYQLVLHPVTASSNLYEMYFALAKNRMYATQGRNTTNALAETVKDLFNNDAEITRHYNEVMANGKWNHIMDQTHIGYTYWQQPEKNVIPTTESIPVRAKGLMGIAIEGSAESWSGKASVVDSFPLFDNISKGAHYFEIFNRGQQSFNYQVKGPAYFKFSVEKGKVEESERVYVSVDWTKALQGQKSAMISVRGNEGSLIKIPVITKMISDTGLVAGFVEKNGLVSMEAAHHTRVVNARPVRWELIPNYGKTAGGMHPVPVTASPVNPKEGSPRLEFDFYTHTAGDVRIDAYISPTIDFTNNQGLKYAVSIDDGEPVIVNISKDYRNDRTWGQSVANSIKIFHTPLTIPVAGKHTLKYWMVDPGVILQKLVVDMGIGKQSFLGPEETFTR